MGLTGECGVCSGLRIDADILGLYLEAAVTRLQEWPPDSGDAAAALPESVLAPPAGFRRLPEGAFIDDFLQRFLPEGLLSAMGGVGVG